MSRKRNKRAEREAKIRTDKYNKRCEKKIAPPVEREEFTAEQLNDMFTNSTNVKEIPLGLLRIHSVHGDRNPYSDTPQGHNRRLNCAGHIRKSDGWNPLACQVLTVCEGGDGKFDVIDGAGRLYMADQLSGGNVKTLTCRVLTKLTNKEIVKLFAIMGTEITKVSKWDEYVSHRSEQSELGREVRGVLAIRDKYKTVWPKMSISVVRFLYSRGALERAAPLVANTPLGASRVYSSIFAAVTGALIGDPRFDEARFRTVAESIGTTEYLYDVAQRRANKLGYPRPHERTIAWLAAVIVAEEYNKGLGAARRLDTERLDKIETPYKDAYSSAPPPPKKRKFGVIEGGLAAEVA